MKAHFILTALTLLVGVTAVMADPPDPEDVLRPEPDGGYFFLQLNGGLGVNFLLSGPARPVNGNLLAETENSVIDGGAGAAFDLGLDLGYMFSDNFAMRLGADFAHRKVSGSGVVTSLCTIPNGQGGSVSSQEIAVDMDYLLGGDYLALRLQGDYYFGKYFVMLGYGLGIPLSAQYEETDRIQDTSNACTYFPDGADATKEVHGEIGTSGVTVLSPALRHTLHLGLGYRKQLGESTDLVLQLFYEHPFTSYLSAPAVVSLRNEQLDSTASRTYDVDINPDASIGTLYATIGIRFNFD